jgi:hypothetical protein
MSGILAFRAEHREQVMPRYLVFPDRSPLSPKFHPAAKAVVDNSQVVWQE